MNPYQFVEDMRNVMHSNEETTDRAGGLVNILLDSMDRIDRMRTLFFIGAFVNLITALMLLALSLTK